MKTLIIVRHGKSDWSYEELADIDRPLKPRGVNDAYNMAGRLKSKNIIPDLIITSPANRALYTSIIFAREIGVSLNQIEINESLYFSYESDILQIIKNVNDTISTLMIFGHNPTFTNFANEFVKNQIDNIPTSGIVLLKFNIENWKQIAKDKLEEEFLDYPKNI